MSKTTNETSQEESRSPLWTISIGGVQASCFEPNRITFQKRYRKGDEFATTNQFYLRDIPVALEVLRVALSRLMDEGVQDHTD